MVEFMIGCIGSGFIGALLGAAFAARYVTRNYACPAQPESRDEGEAPA